ncbi:hypothetical protein PLICRDRAFT_172680 [Plicaturopsis crispa FD-325 SS-3]|nr:hypothetical protein PLICRDRAFT_172680 [Plicaturopsis crispa FD-325 SS-3]
MYSSVLKVHRFFPARRVFSLPTVARAQACNNPYCVRFASDGASSNALDRIDEILRTTETATPVMLEAEGTATAEGTTNSTPSVDGVSRTLSRQRLKPGLASLPLVPPLSAPLITQQELDQYVKPLYKHHWGIQTTVRSSRGGDDAKKVVPQLVRRFLFSRYQAAADFVQKVSAIAIAEDHHPVLSLAFNEVHVSTYTHRTNDNAPGITVLDIRLAILASRLFEETFAVAGGGAKQTPSASLRPQRERPGKISALQEELAEESARLNTNVVDDKAKKPCVICGEWHFPRHCPRKHIVPPQKPCSFCGEMHWRTNCPHLRKRSDGRPSHPCLKCGEMHWHNECPLRHTSKSPAPLLHVPPT